MSTCAACGAVLPARHHVAELAATRPPYDARRWAFCDTHADALAGIVQAHIDIAQLANPEVPDA